jgi:hypothetical protein
LGAADRIPPELGRKSRQSMSIDLSGGIIREGGQPGGSQLQRGGQIVRVNLGCGGLSRLEDGRHVIAVIGVERIGRV